MDVTRETGVISPTDLPILAIHRFLATIHNMTPEIPSIHDQPIVSEFPDVFPDELPGIPPVRE
nr:putative reverse transcriptase domain-containing protein [Tanacetum cinerariifolium]